MDSNDSSDGLFKNKPDIVIAIYGEKPYAEMFGDIEDIKFSDHAVLDQIKFIKSKNSFNNSFVISNFCIT